MLFYRLASSKTMILLFILLSGIILFCLHIDDLSATTPKVRIVYSLQYSIRHFNFSPISACQLKQSKLKSTQNGDMTVDSIDDNTPVTEEYIQSLLQVFGADSLQQRTQQTEQLNPKPHDQFSSKIQKNQSKFQKKSRSDLITETLSSLSQLLPFKNDMRLGSNSNQDVYVQLNASQNWNIDQNLKLDTSQTYRYGVDNKNFFNTKLKLSHTQSQIASAYSQFNLTYMNHEDENFIWEDRTYQKYQFLKNHSLILGMYSSGYYDKEMTLNSWGPYLSWQQPIWRNWLYIQSDLNYYNNKQNALDHTFGSRLGFELHF
ncbi:hypothetical protein [Acinetobacter silvestris]|uniref:Selenocysteine synthase n=1 Tax=Acinetobacter silvestris TaxID=1977882 RepID=A0A1Y3CMX9_9GAMM|nr:hypothetical protein [Acinetobacter silvestris]OTG67194.1 hypothetical protein B9T28_00710 [Acinetobacter silvestris]